MNSYDNVKNLSELKKDSDIKDLSYISSPGSHCGLYGSMLVTNNISELVTVVIGTEECAYYTKLSCINKGKLENSFSLVLNDNDIALGFDSKLEAFLEEIIESKSLRAIVVVTTCIVELIGTDIEPIINNIEERFNVKILLVKTEHFKCDNYLEGIEKTLTGMSKLVKYDIKQEESVNILGSRNYSIMDSELVNTLKENNIKINSEFPYNCNSLKVVENLGKAKLNIVVDYTALNLAKKMKANSNIDYIIFYKNLNPYEINNQYKNLFSVLNIDSYKIKSKFNYALDLVEKHKYIHENETFICDSMLMSPFKITNFLMGLKMKPIMIQAKQILEYEKNEIESILSNGENPKVCKQGNLSELKNLYKLNTPNVFIGTEDSKILEKYNIKHIRSFNLSMSNGFDLLIEFLNLL